MVGKEAPGLSPATVSRLKANWQQELDQWQKRDLSDKQYVYFWADGIYCNVRMDDKQCLLVIIGATEDGDKELVAIEGGFRGSEPGGRPLKGVSRKKHPPAEKTYCFFFDTSVVVDSVLSC